MKKLDEMTPVLVAVAKNTKSVMGEILGIFGLFNN
tara:strand:+ start:36 stop:140 length:105 start_codon:yes stop_codon:yes gene_type:complete